VTTTTVNNVGALTTFDKGCAKALQDYFVSTCTVQGYCALLIFFAEGALCGLLVYIVFIVDKMKKKKEEKDKDEKKKLIKKSSTRLKGSVSKSKPKPRKRGSAVSVTTGGEGTTTATTAATSAVMVSTSPSAYNAYQQPAGYTMPYGLNDNGGRYYNPPMQPLYY